MALAEGEDRVESGRRLKLAVEEERVCGAAANGPVVEPAITVGDAPEGDALHNGLVLKEDGEEIGVAFGKLLLDVGRESGGVGVGIRLRLIGLLVRGEDVNVQLGNGDLDAGSGQLADGLVFHLGRGPIQLQVALHSDDVDLDALGLELADQGDDTGALGGDGEIVVVVVEPGGGIGFVGVLEGFGDVVLADDVQPGRFPQGAVLIDRFVDDVPAGDAALVAADDGPDVILHAGEQGFAGEGLARFVFKDPLRGLAVPDERVADHLHLILLAEGDELVGGLEVEGAGFGVDDFPLQDVFRGDGVELRGDQGGRGSILFGKLRLIQRGSDAEVGGEGGLEGLLGRQRGAGDKQGEGEVCRFHD